VRPDIAQRQPMLRGSTYHTCAKSIFGYGLRCPTRCEILNQSYDRTRDQVVRCHHKLMGEREFGPCFSLVDKLRARGRCNNIPPARLYMLLISNQISLDFAA
jgi:hypothetical protein